MKHTVRTLSLLTLAAVISSCGSTSEIQPTSTNNSGQKKFTKVIVKNFTSTVQDKKGHVQSAKTYFPDRIAKEIRSTGKFRSVSRSGRADSNTLVIDGSITRYDKGTPALRFLIGMGAGSSYFDADVNLRNGSNNRSLGTIKVDKNSWVLGGGFASGQTPTTYMKGAAEDIAEQAATLAR